MDIHVNHMSNVQITTSGHPYKQLTRTKFAHAWILPSQTHTRSMVTCMETHSMSIGGGSFCNWICWTRASISSYECLKDVFMKVSQHIGRENNTVV